MLAHTMFAIGVRINRLEKTSMDACRMFRLDFSPYEFKKNPETNNITVVRYIPVAVTKYRLGLLPRRRELE